MKKTCLILIYSLTFFLLQSNYVSAYGKDKNLKNSFPNPCTFNCNKDDKSSPWRFHSDFEDNSWKGKLTPNDKGEGWVPFKIMEEDGNKFLSITVKHGWNPDKGHKNNPTERSELETSKRQTFGKEVWYGFKIRKPLETRFIKDRMVITQFKQRTRTRPSPMISVGKKNSWGEPKPKSYVAISICGKSGKLGSKIVGVMLPGQYKFSTQSKELMGYNDSSSIKLNCYNKTVQIDLKFNNTKDFQNLITTKWNTIVIGSYVTNTNNGFMKLYLNQNLIYNYNGPTYGWSKIVGSNIRIGIYRDGNKYEEYPPQTLHYDDFVIGSKDDVIDVLWK